jgi:hypothetical protein
MDDAQHRPEEADEGGVGPQGAQKAETFFQKLPQVVRSASMVSSTAALPRWTWHNPASNTWGSKPGVVSQRAAASDQALAASKGSISEMKASSPNRPR